MRQRFTLFDNKPHGIRAAGIVIHNDQILLMHRIKDGQEFYVLPGGGVEAGDTIQHTIIREIAEETCQQVTVNYIAYHLDFPDNSDHYIGVCTYIGGGEVKLGGEEADRQTEQNQYHPQWVPLSAVPNLTLYPERLADWLRDDLPALQLGETISRHDTILFTR